MIRTISMQINPARAPHAIPTKRPARTAALSIALVIAAAVAGIFLVGHSLARAATPVATAPATGQNPVLSVASAADMRSAVQSLAAFPDPYPAAAAVAP